MLPKGARRTYYTPYSGRIEKPTKYERLGGLGANKSEKWEKKQTQHNKIKEFSKNVLNLNKDQFEKYGGVTIKPAAVKHQSARQKAMEFAKAIPKPKKKKDWKLEEEEEDVEKSPDKLGNLEKEHEELQAKIEAMKLKYAAPNNQ